MSSTSKALGGRARARGDRAASRWQLGHANVLIGTTVLSLVVLGLLMILSASSVTSFVNYGSSFWFFKRQLSWAVVGVAAFGVLARTDYRRLRGLGYPLFVVSVGLLCAVLVPGLGITAGGSARPLFAWQEAQELPV